MLVGARGEFGDNATVFLMDALRGDYIAEEQPVAHDGRRSVVARRFDGEYCNVFFFHR